MRLGDWGVPTLEAKKIHELLELNESSVMLDIGCGTGPHARLLAPMVARYDAVDICEKKIKTAQGLPTPPVLQYHCLDAQELPFLDDMFSHIVICHCLHEVECIKQGKILFEAKRVLKPGGTILILDTVAETTPFQECFDILHCNLQFYNHLYPLLHEEWLISKMLSEGIFVQKGCEKLDMEFSFKTIEMLVEMLTDDFRYELLFTKQKKEKVTQLLLSKLGSKNIFPPYTFLETIRIITLMPRGEKKHG